jgi:glycosyltransferase involved in cell wall biosynthesis
MAYRLLYRAITPMVLRRASTVITVSESEKLEILQRYPGNEGRVLAIQNGSTPGSAELLEHTPSADQYVLYVGSLSRRKNLDGLIKVATNLGRKRRLSFVFVGSTPGALANVGAKIPEDVISGIRFEGQIDSWEVLRRYYQTASCFFFPSFYEASPLPPIEAMACGCPVVASGIPSLKERCGDAAMYCDPNSVESMAGSIERVLDDPATQSRLRHLGYERARKFTWRSCAEMTLDAICS